MPSNLKLFRAVFLAIGILLLCFGISTTASRVSFKRTAATTTGRVIRLQPGSSRHGTVYYPVVQFVTPDEQKITVKGSNGSRPAAFHVDDPVEVLYDPDDPHQAYINTFMEFWGSPIILFGLGAVFAAIPSGMFLSQVRRRNRAQWLKQNGQRISTQFQNVERVANVRVGRQNPYRIVSRWQDPVTTRHYVFYSYNLWQDPSPLIYSHPDRPIDVWIEPNNPDRYWLDTDFLGDLAN
ncbi:MAG TPA: DUF3592 domain-containing protein [Candidatus Acidoferrum sp.]|nr:DUF3592 domain-containing protein [Candidatus Acidoferrum sp.]